MSTDEPDPRWRALFPDVDSLREHAGQWPISEAVPVGIANYLRTARALLVQSYFVYEFALVATMWSMLALESALRGCLAAGDSVTLHRLIDRAQERGLIDESGASALHEVRKLRNEISHHAISFNVAPGAVLQWVGALQEAVSEIYERASRSSSGPES
jgi:hypothetical protein